MKKISKDKPVEKEIEIINPTLYKPETNHKEHAKNMVETETKRIIIMYK